MTRSSDIEYIRALSALHSRASNCVRCQYSPVGRLDGHLASDRVVDTSGRLHVQKFRSLYEKSRHKARTSQGSEPIATC